MTTPHELVSLEEALEKETLTPGDLFERSPNTWWYPWPVHCPIDQPPSRETWHKPGRTLGVIEGYVVYLEAAADPRVPGIIYIKALHPEHGVMITRLLGAEAVRVLRKNSGEKP